MNEQNTALLGAYIRISRESRGWSLRDLAAEAGISHTTVDNIERGYDPRTGRQTNVTLDTLGRLAAALSVTLAHLLSCLDGSASVSLSRPVDTWYDDERADMDRERGGVREYLRLKWGCGTVHFPTHDDAETVAKRVLFDSYIPTDAEWQQVKRFAEFLQSNRHT